MGAGAPSRRCRSSATLLRRGEGAAARLNTPGRFDIWGSRFGILEMHLPFEQFPALSAIDAVTSAVWIQLFAGRIRSRHWRTEHLYRNVRQPQAPRHDNEDLLHRQRRRRHGRTEGTLGRTHFDYDAKDEREVTAFNSRASVVCHPERSACQARD